MTLCDGPGTAAFLLALSSAFWPHLPSREAFLPPSGTPGRIFPKRKTTPLKCFLAPEAHPKYRKICGTGSLFFMNLPRTARVLRTLRKKRGKKYGEHPRESAISAVASTRSSVPEVLPLRAAPRLFRFSRGTRARGRYGSATAETYRNPLPPTPWAEYPRTTAKETERKPCPAPSSSGENRSPGQPRKP